MRYLFLLCLSLLIFGCDGEEPTGGEVLVLTGISWINIPAGSFMMGSNSGGYYEVPIHRVMVQSFQMSETEVTVGQYRQCVEAGRCSEPSTESPPSLECTWSASPSDKEDHPINCLDWGQARTFAVWEGGDLPTEAQWEYAARGGEDFEYAGSDNADEVAWYDENSQHYTQPVKTKRANGYGLYDMSGNVWEWTLDEPHHNYQGAPSEAETPWGNVPPCSQVCDDISSGRVVRGGSWYDDAVYLGVALRIDYSPDDRRYNLGFRVRRTLP